MTPALPYGDEGCERSYQQRSADEEYRGQSQRKLHSAHNAQAHAEAMFQQ